ncbi:hypothetical protein VTN77DRAFT_1671 [Rasamsonia byssochlamydoides]|uniref:uncharacterized protein n=1 Tax=Rasamsonia byssochlamydoides TaxID=89139 RepID=UPI0037445B66
MEKGNILWDCITYIDNETVQRINKLGGIEAMVISHPHCYSTSLHWALVLDWKVYMPYEDLEGIITVVQRKSDGKCGLALEECQKAIG